MSLRKVMRYSLKDCVPSQAGCTRLVIHRHPMESVRIGHDRLTVHYYDSESLKFEFEGEVFCLTHEQAKDGRAVELQLSDGQEALFRVASVQGSKIKLMIEAPPTINIDREEVYWAKVAQGKITLPK